FFMADERPPQFNEGQGPPNKDGQNPPPRRMRSSLTLFTNQQPGADNQQNRVGQENRGDGAAGDANEVLNQQDNENPPVGNREPAAGNN
ncbi:hypothetical protein TNCT_198081, partial [Trichonephila clavata]